MLLTGRTLCTIGLRYWVQSVKILKNLSRPAKNGTRPKVNRNAHHVE
jgi:hypothetical protein